MKTLRKALLFGLGATVYTVEKIEEVVDNLIKRGELAKEERAKAVQDLIDQAEKERKAFVDTVKQSVERAVSEMGLVTKKDFDQLLNRLNEIEKRLARSGTEQGTQ